MFGPLGAIEADVARLTDAGVVGAHAVELPPEAETYRAEVREFIERYQALPEDQQLGAFLDSGYALAHWPKPWGRAAERGRAARDRRGARRRRRERPQYGIGGWVIQTITQHADDDQIERWIRPSLEHEYVWCQLFSEPGAGSDAAGIRTRATKTDGGWLVNGQKVWTSGAAFCNRGFATVRTDPDKPKHDGITMMVIDLEAQGVDIRPLREASGGELFCEVFFDDVFVPDDDVVGPVERRVEGGALDARQRAGEHRRRHRRRRRRVRPARPRPPSLRHGPPTRPRCEAVGRLLAERRAMQLLNLRSAERAVAGAEPGPGGQRRQAALRASTSRRQAALALRLARAGRRARRRPRRRACRPPRSSPAALTIAGGTSEIVRSTIGERLLGLPRDPLLR